MVLPVTAAEAQTMADALGVPLREPNGYNANAHCPALDVATNACMAYESRPQVCRDFQCNGEDRFSHTGESLVKMQKLADRQEPIHDLRAFLEEPVHATFARHKKIGFQFSGGKDSTAALLYLREYWSRMTVYFCDSGDSMPETLDIVRQVQGLGVNVTVIQGRTREVRAKFGQPTDLLPWTSAPAAHHHNTGYTPLMQDRVACCSRSVMAPLHERMESDGITLLIRGQKRVDAHSGTFRNGDVHNGIEFFYPIYEWTDEQCFAYMRAHGIEPQRFYAEGMTHSGDCATCTAWTEDDRGAYLQKYHPVKFVDYRKNMRMLADAIYPQLQTFTKELEVCDGHAL
jgi:phosphoadenosine phosphosulfate reductase